MRTIIILAMLAVSACAHHGRDLPKTSKSDPIFPLNVGKWEANTNDLTVVPQWASR